MDTYKICKKFDQWHLYSYSVYFKWKICRKYQSRKKRNLGPYDLLWLSLFAVAEVGDYHPEDHPMGYVSEFKMLPKQNAKMEAEIMAIHKTLT